MPRLDSSFAVHELSSAALYSSLYFVSSDATLARAAVSSASVAATFFPVSIRRCT